MDPPAICSEVAARFLIARRRIIRSMNLEVKLRARGYSRSRGEKRREDATGIAKWGIFTKRVREEPRLRRGISISVHFRSFVIKLGGLSLGILKTMTSLASRPANRRRSWTTESRCEEASQLLSLLDFCRS